MANQELERLFITLLADDSQLQRQLDAIVQKARGAAEEVSRAFEVGASRGFVDAGNKVEASAARQKRAIDPVKEALERVKNETAALRNTVEAGSTSNDEAIKRFNELGASALKQASAFEVTSKEYRGFTQAAAMASRSVKTLSGEATKLGFSGNAAVGISTALRQNMNLLGPAGAQASRSLGLVGVALGGFARTGPGAIGALDGIMRGITRMTSMLPLLGALATGAALVGLVKLGNAAAEVADKIDKGSQAAGLSAEAYQELRYAFDQSGVASEQFDRALQTLNRRIGQAAGGNDALQRSFSRLGVSITDLSTGAVRDTEKVFTDAINAISRLPSAAEQAAAASELFGDRIGGALLPALSQGVEGIEGLREAARTAGLVLSGRAVMSLVQYKDALKTLQGQFQTARTEIVAAFIPVLTNSLIPLLQNTVIPAIQSVADRVQTFTERLADTSAEGAEFRAQLVANLSPLVTFGQTAVGVGASVYGAFQTMIAGAAQLGAYLGTLIAEFERDPSNVLRSIAPLNTGADAYAMDLLGRELKVDDTALERARKAGEEAAQKYYEAALNSFDLAGAAFTFDLEQLINDVAEQTNAALSRGAGNLFGGDPDAPGGGTDRAFLGGSLAALRQALTKAQQAYAEAGDAAGRAFQTEVIAGIQAAIVAIEAEIQKADPFRDALRWTLRLGRELEFGLKSAADVFDIINPRAQQLRDEIAGLIKDGDFDSAELGVLIGKLDILEALLTRIGNIDRTIEVEVAFPEGSIGALERQLAEREAIITRAQEAMRLASTQGQRDVVGRIMSELQAEIDELRAEIAELERQSIPITIGVTPVIQVREPAGEIDEFGRKVREDLQRALEAAAASAALFGTEGELASRQVDLVRAAIERLIQQNPGAFVADLALQWRDLGLSIGESVGSLAATIAAQLRFGLIDVTTAIDILEPKIEQLTAAATAALADFGLDSAEYRDAVRELDELQAVLRALGEPIDIVFNPRVTATGDELNVVSEEVQRRLDAAAAAAEAFGTQSGLAAVQAGILAAEINRVLAGDAPGDISGLVALWADYSAAARDAADATRDFDTSKTALESVRDRLAALSGAAQTEFERFREVVIAAFDFGVIDTDELDELLAVIEGLPSVIKGISLEGIADQLERDFAAAEAAAAAFGDATGGAAEKQRLLEAAIRATLALEPTADVSKWVAAWLGYKDAVTDTQGALDAYAGALDRLNALLGFAPSELDLLTEAFEAAYAASVITDKQLKILLDTIAKLSDVDAAANAMRGLASSLDLFASGIGGLEEALRGVEDKDFGAFLSGLTSVGVAIGTAIGGPAAGAIVAAVGDAIQAISSLAMRFADLFTGDSPARRELAKSLASAVASGFRTGILDGLKGAEGWQERLRENVQEAVIGALIDAFIQAAIVTAIFQPFIDEFTRQLNRNGEDAAWAFFDREFPKVMENATNAAEEFVRRGQRYFKQAEQIGEADITPGKIELPNATVTVLAAPQWALELNTAARYMSDAGIAMTDAALLMQATFREGITVNSSGSRGIDAMRAA